MASFSRFILYALAVAGLLPNLAGQKFLPDDPIQRDPDDLSISQPAPRKLSPTFDLLENTFGSEADEVLVKAENTNTLGEVPDSSWFTNRIGIRDMSVAEVVQGGVRGDGPDSTESLVVVAAGLGSISEGLVLEDEKSDRYYLVFDRKGYPNLATGAALISSKFLHAAGYKVAAASLAFIDPEALEIHPEAPVLTLGETEARVDREYLSLFFEDKQEGADGRYRAVAYRIPEGVGIGEFKFYGVRTDDPNDIFLHENRRELRGLKVFAAWLNHYKCSSINTRDFYVTRDQRSFVEHYLVDMTTSLGSGHDLDDRFIPKDEQSGYEYNVWGNTLATVKTALSLGLWVRPWMTIEYPLEQYPEIGRIEGDYFDPAQWVTDYPNPAFDRMLPDDALWAARILSRFSDEAIRAVVQSARYSNPDASEYLAKTLIKRRDKLVDHYLKPINPLARFRLQDGIVHFDNLGEERGLASKSSYEYQWFELNNDTEQLIAVTDREFTGFSRMTMPVAESEYLMLRVRTRSSQERGWRKNVDVYLRLESPPRIVGIDREIGILTLERTLEGRLVPLSSVEFGGSYQGLEEEQRRLVDDWFERFNRFVDRDLDPEEGYSRLPLSVRTTYEAATNALIESDLTDENGRVMGRALDLIERLDSVHGRIRGVGGDQQFRMYVALRPDALEWLEKSQEFKRGADNTIYHKGYPLSYRQQEYPSIQVSVSRDGLRADIDVDYRSSKFPAALVNGHLTAANSDVRAGDNYNRHVGRWEGFVNWWRAIFGLPVVADLLEEVDPEATLIPTKPPRGDGELEEAVEDFLQSWLIRSRPEAAVAYVSEKAYACMPVWESMDQIDFGIAPFVLLERMMVAAKGLPKTASLTGIVSPAALEDERLSPAENRRPELFTLYQVPEDVAAGMDCSSWDRSRSEEASQSSWSGRFFLSVAAIRDGSGQQRKVALLWSREEGQWKVFSYLLDAEDGRIEIPGTPEPEVTLEHTEGDPDNLEANRQFLQLWRQNDIEGALAYVSGQSLPCLRFYSEGSESASDEEVMEATRQGMRRIAERLSATSDVRDVIRAVEFVHPEIRIVDHPAADMISLAALPDHLAEQYRCENLGKRVSGASVPEGVYGNHYVTGFQLDLIGNDGGVLYLLWSRQETAWKITAIHIVVP